MKGGKVISMRRSEYRLPHMRGEVRPLLMLKTPFYQLPHMRDEG